VRVARPEAGLERAGAVSWLIQRRSHEMKTASAPFWYTGQIRILTGPGS
jgi:hypothetical protein